MDYGDNVHSHTHIQVLLDILRLPMTSQNIVKPKCLRGLASEHQLQSASLQWVSAYKLIVCLLLFVVCLLLLYFFVVCCCYYCCCCCCIIYVISTTPGGESGSADTVRDPRGFAVKVYTEEGNWDLVGNNTPIFFIRDPLMVSCVTAWEETI